MTSPDFSPIASQYARSRPGYPAELFTHLANLLERRKLAWDCATGNGQAALALAEHFDQVVATDVSAEQIHHAFPHPRIDYRVAPAEESGLGEGTIDLVTIASAIHWFDLKRFHAEMKRVVRPGGVAAAWTYHVGHVEPPLDHVFWRFYDEVLRPFFSEAVRVVDQRYETLALPGVTIEHPPFFMTARWNLDQMISFIESWSGTQRYIEARGQSPVALIEEELGLAWGDRAQVRTVRWPLYVRIVRL